MLTPWDACLRDDRAKALRAQAVHQQPAVCMPLHVLGLKERVEWRDKEIIARNVIRAASNRAPPENV